MIGLFLITHGSLGESLVQCACHVLGGQPPHIAQLGVAGQDDPLAVLPRARDMLRSVDTGGGALLLTDIFGATPGNIALKLLQPGRIEGVAGVSLPMLLRALTYRDKDMQTLVAKTLAGGRDGVILMKGATDAAG
ncbi:MAG: PTS fructose transporter subunit IIA [Zoogloeaceae bacterium]|jgi:PTS system ascorbate-specific IIA component|nr:PTS fructose transporter subunit IIA [Zoogloeaceae bacterium]